MGEYLFSFKNDKSIRKLALGFGAPESREQFCDIFRRFTFSEQNFEGISVDLCIKLDYHNAT